MDTKSSAGEAKRRRCRWGGRADTAQASLATSAQCSKVVNGSGSRPDIRDQSSRPLVSEEEAMAALLAAAGKEGKSGTSPAEGDGRGRTLVAPPISTSRDASHSHCSDAVVDESRRCNSRKRARQFDLDGRTTIGGDNHADHGATDEVGEGSGRPPEQKKKPDFGLSGALASDDLSGNSYNGVVLKFTEPPEARIPNTKWRLYVFRKSKSSDASEGDLANGDVLSVLHVSRQSAYLFGRERRVADIPVDHPSLSKQHCVLQYRSLPDPAANHKLRCRPYLMDLASTNGTFINGVRIEEARYYELKKGDVVTLGQSTREYVLLTENTTAA